MRGLWYACFTLAAGLDLSELSTPISTGVRRVLGSNVFQAQIELNGRAVNLGIFPTAEAAGQAHDR